MKKSLLVDIITYCYILLFVYAAANKLIDVQKFEVQIGQSPILRDFAPVLAWAVPLSEIVIVVLLTFRKTMLYGLYASLGIMVMFTLYIIAILNFSASIPCSCGGILENMKWHEHLIFNIVFVLIALAAIILHGDKREKITEPKFI